MIMADNRQWLDAGLSTLEKHGARALTIERLADQVGLTKGSFYHHFGGMAAYKTALLSHYELIFTTQYIEVAEQDAAASPMARLERLNDRVCADPDQDIEVALRTWALQDPEVRAAQERVDRLRYEYVRDVWFELTGDEEQAALAGRLIYLLLIGAQQHLPPIKPDELRRLSELLLRLLGDRAAGGRPRS